MTSSSSRAALGISLASLGWRPEEETLFLSLDLFLAVAVLLGGFSRISEGGKLIALMISSILLDCLCEEL